MVSKIIQICCLIIISNLGFSQTNLISNPGFENHTICPNFGGQINYCTNWNNVNLVYNNFSVGTPDYFHTCGSGTTVPPNTFAGQCNPHLGSAMTALVMYNAPFPGYREYMSSPLSCVMTPGNTYTVSFWLTNGLNPISPYRIKNIGIHFSNSSLTQSGYSLINVVPQLELTTLVGSTGWVQYTFTINPTSNWQHITIGSFRPDSQNSPTSSYSITTGPASVYANYFFDDIQVLSSGNSGSFSVTSTVSNIKCNGSANGSATVMASGVGPHNYLWSPGNYTASAVNNLNVGTYTVNISDGACNTSTTSVTITQPPALTTSLTASSYTICKNDTITLNSVTSGGTPSYSVNWNTGAIGTPSIASNPSVTSVYSYTVTDANLCKTSSTISIVVISTPTISINTQNICSGISNTLTVSGATTYNWLPGNIVGSFNIVNLTNPTIYTVTAVTNSCSTTTTFSIGVNSTPTLSVNSSTICFGQTASLSAISSINNYTWSSSGLTTSSISVSPSLTSTFSVISSINSCSAIAIATVVVSSLPNIVATNSLVVCSGQAVILNATGANTYTWFPGSIVNNTISVSPLSNTQYTVLGESLNGCASSSIVQVNTVNSLTVNINSLIICKGEPAFLVANSNGNQFHWEPSTICQTPNNNSTYVYPSSTTVFTFETSFNGNCFTTVTTNVIVNDMPVVFAGNDTTINIGDPLVLLGNSNYSNGWKALDEVALDCNYCSSVSISPVKNTCYVLESITSQNCRVSDTICIKVNKDWTLYIPNAFSPNNDLINDVFLPYGFGVENYELYIYDRWGEQIFKSDADHRGWNGYYKNYICEMGVYTYMIVINTFSKQEESRIGHVTLLK